MERNSHIFGQFEQHPEGSIEKAAFYVHIWESHMRQQPKR